MRIGIWEILLIIVLVLILFGGSKLAGVGKSLGRGIKEFKEEVHRDEGKAPAAQEEAAQAGTDKTEKPAAADNRETDKKENTENTE